jgi:hypothetical protein
MRSRPHDTLEEWLATPVPTECADPRFEVRAAELADFDRVYDAVDDAFAVKRPRAVYDWLYRKNPLGPARCWLLVEKATGEIVTVAARLRWPRATHPSKERCWPTASRSVASSARVSATCARPLAGPISGGDAPR